MKVLIATEPDDMHAILVKLALEDLGHDCHLRFTADMPTKQKNSIYLANDEFHWISEDNNNNLTATMTDPLDVVWWRRPRVPFVPDSLNENDLKYIKKENLIFHDAIPLVFSNDAWWINSYPSFKNASSKIYQLKLASNCGFKIPPTLISNSAASIKEFIKTYQQESVIYKPFSPHNWYENNVLKFYYTKIITLNQLPTDSLLQMTPGIFQKKIKKKYELRVTCFGTHLVAIKINSQKHTQTLDDWRTISPQKLELEPYQLSAPMEKNIRSLMNKLGIVFGCFDFIVTPDDEVYFLEVNQQGQFLWIE